MPRKPRRRAVNRIASPVKRRVPLRLTTAGAQPGAGIVLAVPAAPAAVWRTRRPKLVAAALVVALFAALLAFFNTDQFYVYNVEVVGNEFLTAAEVERATGVVGYNVFFIEPQSVERVLSRLPEVSGVRVTAAVPNHLTVAVTERVPDITWLRGSETYWVDADGIPFRARATLPELTVVRDLDQQPVKPGQVLTTGGLLAVQTLRAAWQDAPRAYEWSAARGLSFNDEHGWRIYLGDASEMAGKLAKYRAVTAQLVAVNAKIKFIDLGKGDPYYQ